MVNFLVAVLLIVLALLFCLLELIFISSTIIGLKNNVPFVSTPKSVIDEIDKALNIREGSVVYDLGCGNGKILFYLFDKNPKIKCVGFENNVHPLVSAKCRLFFSSKKEKAGIKIIKGNFFNKDLTEATHVFVYLSSDLMDKLLPKFEKELVSGTRLVSLSFPFKNKTPIQEIDLKRAKHKLARELYVYQF